MRPIAVIPFLICFMLSTSVYQIRCSRTILYNDGKSTNIHGNVSGDLSIEPSPFQTPDYPIKDDVPIFGTGDSSGSSSRRDTNDTGKLGSFPVSEQCHNDIMQVSRAYDSHQVWARKMIDSQFKPPSGIMQGNLRWLAYYDECVVISHTYNQNKSQHTFVGKYCAVTARVRLGRRSLYYDPSGGPNGTTKFLELGLCTPSSCSDVDVVSVMKNIVEGRSFADRVTIDSAACQDPFLEYDDKALVSLCVMGILLFFIAIGTLYDTYLNAPLFQKTDGTNQSDKGNVQDESRNSADDNDVVHVQRESIIPPSEATCFKVAGLKGPLYKDRIGRFLLAFSLYSNGGWMLNTDRGPDMIKAVDGFRFITMAWIILYQSYKMAIDESTNPVIAKSWATRFTFRVIDNATFAVDSLFAVGGLMVTYLTLRKMKRLDGKLKWHWFYVRKYLRMIPAYALWMIFYIPLFGYMYSGPIWPQKGVEKDFCSGNWFYNLLFVNNMQDMKESCMEWSWYLANNMQFFALSPAIIWPLYHYPKIGYLVLTIGLTVSTLTAAVISGTRDMGIIPTSDTHGMADMYYVKPWCRIGPYLVGMLTGYILYRTECRVKLSKKIVVLGWMTSKVLAITTVYGVSGVYQGTYTPSAAVAAIYNSLSRTVWGVAVCWVLFACATGYGGPANGLLSWKAFVPVSRLSYMVFLIHPVVLMVSYYGRRTLFYLTDIHSALAYLGVLPISYMAAFVFCLAFESPWISIGRAFFHEKKEPALRAT